MSLKKKSRVVLNGLDDETNQALNERIDYFEENHEADIISNGEGWIPRITSGDYIFAGTINLLITLWLIISLLG